MARCTVRVRGHNSAAAQAACPACSSRYGGSRGDYGSGNHSSFSSGGGSRYSNSGRSSGGGSSRPRWSRAGSSVSYTPAQEVSLTPVRDAIEKVYVTDHGGTKIPTAGATGTVTLLAGKTKVVSALKPDGDNRLTGHASYASTPDMKAVVK